MSRVEGMAAIASKRLAAQAELQQLIAGTGSLLAAGTSLGEQAIAVCYTRSGDRVTHTQEFYPEGFYNLEQAAKMLQIHQTFGGKCMYEMFCDAAGGLPPVREPGVALEGLPNTDGPGYGIHADADYVYIGHRGNGGVGITYSIVRKSDWTLVPDLPRTGTYIATAIYADDDHVYIFGVGVFCAISKSDWDIVVAPTRIPSSNTDYPSSVGAIISDDDYVYIGHRGGSSFTVVRKSDWSYVDDKPLNRGSGSYHNTQGVYVDDEYVYTASGNYYQSANYSKVIRKSDWSTVSEFPTINRSANSIHADNEYVYVGGGKLTIVRKSDWSIAMDITTIKPNAIWSHGDHVYMTGSGHDEYLVLRKSDWSLVENIPRIEGYVRGYDIYVDDEYVYVARDGAGAYSVIPHPI